VTEPRPYRRLSPLSPFVRSGIIFVAVIGATWHDLLRGEFGPVGLILLALLAIGLAYGLASWWRTKYWIDGDELRVDTGVISKQSRRIRVDRLQSIDIAQPVLARLFGLAELKMDVAGGHRAEGSLAFLRLGEAQQLREQLLARRDLARHEAATAATAATSPMGQPLTPPPERVIAKLDLGRLLVSILLSGHTVGVVVSGAGFMVLFVATGQFAGAATMVPVVGGFLLAQFRKLSAFYDFTVAQTPAGLQVRRGLLELNSQTIALHRVQGVRIIEPFLWRRLGWARLDVSIAGVRDSDSNDRPSSSTVMPVAPLAMVADLGRQLLAGSPGATTDPATVQLSVPPIRARWVAPIWRKFCSFGIGEGIVVGRRGMLSRRTEVVPLARIQSVNLHQGPVQRLLGLADLDVDSPPGPVHASGRHQDAGSARRLLDTVVVASREARLTAARGSHPSQ
jgi:putative membrane protein